MCVTGCEVTENRIAQGKLIKELRQITKTFQKIELVSTFIFIPAPEF